MDAVDKKEIPMSEKPKSYFADCPRDEHGHCKPKGSNLEGPTGPNGERIEGPEKKLPEKSHEQKILIGKLTKMITDDEKRYEKAGKIADEAQRGRAQNYYLGNINGLKRALYHINHPEMPLSDTIT